jgi:glycosyltransferase involved in cell wall biosynthesis
MHVGLAIYGNLDTLTGGWIYDRLVVEHLQEQGHTVDVISLKRRNYVRNLADNFSPRLFRRLRDHECRLLLEDELNHPSLFRLNLRLKQGRRRPVVGIVHQVLCRQPLRKIQQLFYRAIERRYFQSVDGFIFNSQTTRANVASLIDLRQPSLVAYPGGDRLGWLESDAGIASKCLQTGPLRLIFVGNLLPNKGVLQLITGLARLPEKSWHLCLVGSLTMDRGYAQKVRALIARRGLNGQVDMTGPLDGQDLVRRLSASHVFVLPFSYEGFGIACLEAMAWGLPVIGSGAGALKELVQDGVNGLLVAPGDVGAFAEKILRLHGDRKLLARCGAAALQTFHLRPRWKDSLQKINSFLVSMAENAKNEADPRLDPKDPKGF